jgi:hypothetical protein
MIELTHEQKLAYARFIKARDRINNYEYVPHSDVARTVDFEGMNHPLFEHNDLYEEYKEASMAWWEIEPEFRKTERMRMSRGDYGSQDSWEERTPNITDSYIKLREE